MAGATRMLQRRGTAAEWAAANPVLGDGEIGFVRDTRDFKIGDGVTAWNDLVSGHMSPGIFNAKGDLLVATGPGEYTTVPVGGNGTLLVPDDTQPGGMKWTNVVRPTAVDHIGLIIERLANQSAHMQEYQDENGATLSAIDYAGRPGFKNGGIFGALASLSYAYLEAIAPTPDSHITLVRGASGQTAHMSEWQDSNGNILAYVDKDGNFHSTVHFLTYLFDAAGTGSYLVTSPAGSNSGAIQAIARDGSHIPFWIAGGPSQTADLLRFTDSGGSVLSRIDNNGRLRERSGSFTPGISTSWSWPLAEGGGRYLEAGGMRFEWGYGIVGQTAPYSGTLAVFGSSGASLEKGSRAAGETDGQFAGSCQIRHNSGGTTFVGLTWDSSLAPYAWHGDYNWTPQIYDSVSYFIAYPIV